MNQIAIAALLSIMVAGQAVADGIGFADSEGTVHFGIKFGQSNIVNNPVGLGVYGGYTMFGPNSFRQNEHLSKLSVAVQGEYVDLGHSASPGFTYNGASFSVSGVATYPLDERFSVIAKAGPASVSYKDRCGWSSSCTVGSSSRIVALHAGAAVQYQLSPLMSLRAGYDFYSAGYNMMSAGIVYRFDPAPAGRISREKVIAPQRSSDIW